MVTASGPFSANSRSAASHRRSRKSATSVSVRTRGIRLARSTIHLPRASPSRIDLQRKTHQSFRRIGLMDGEVRINPYLAGNFAPVRSEDDFDLEVEGEIPAGMRGALFRTGPNPQFEPR